MFAFWFLEKTILILHFHHMLLRLKSQRVHVDVVHQLEKATTQSEEVSSQFNRRFRKDRGREGCETKCGIQSHHIIINRVYDGKHNRISIQCWKN